MDDNETKKSQHNIPTSEDVPELAAELEAAQVPPMTQVENDPRLGAVIESIRHVYDPEIPVNVYELGLIYHIGFSESNPAVLNILMTLTSPNCPVAEELPQWVKEAALKADGIDSVEVELSWDPPWSPSLMAESARYQLNMF
mgnify:CR=1 FL=1